MVVWLSFLLSLLSIFSLSADDDLSIAREALRDGLWDVARAHALPSASTNDEARLVVLESWAGEGLREQIAKSLETWKDSNGLGFDYYRAIVAGDHATAAAILKDGGSAEGVLEAKLMEADELAKSGSRAAAEVLWRAVASATNAPTRAFAIAAVNLMDAALLRRAYADARTLREKRIIGLRLGRALMRGKDTVAEGMKLVRAVVRDSPDADGAQEAFLAMADVELEAERWKSAADIYTEAVEIWPEAVKRSSVQEGRGWALLKLGKREDALAAFAMAEELAVDGDAKATAILKQGDVLSEMGRGDEAMAKYREVVANYPKAPFAERIRKLVAVRENEAKGRALYRDFRFEEARRVFAEVAKDDPSRRPRMEFYEVLCLYGQGADSEAAELAERIVASCSDDEIRSAATLWLAKFRYNMRDWKAAGRLFAACAEAADDGVRAAEALMWAARAALAESDFARAIALSTRLAARYPRSSVLPQALLVQGEALIELARFDEAVLVLDRVAVIEQVPAAERVRAQTLRADALYAMGADNPARYTAALEAYRAIRFGGTLSESEQIVVSFKIARVLEKMKRMDEAVDQYYTQVVMAYRSGRKKHIRFDDEARAAFSRAAFRLAEEYESRGRDGQAVAVLRLVEQSDVPAAAEAAKRIGRILAKGRFL